MSLDLTLVVVLYTAGMATTELLIWVYAIFIRDNLKERNNRRRGLIKQGTYLEVTFWDLGFKSGNLPAIRLDDIWDGLNNTFNRDSLDKLKKLLMNFMSEKEANEIVKEHIIYKDKK